jgi:hypothetical protein
MKELKESIETAIAAKEAIYGKISKVEHTGEMGMRIIQAPDVRRIMKESKNIEDNDC